MEIPHPNANFPLPVDKPRGGANGQPPSGTSMFKDATVAWASFTSNTNIDPIRVEVAFASAGYYRCIDNVGDCNSMSVEDRNLLDNLLNNAPASFEGALLCYDNPGRYFYISSRNNNFTNRSQKGMLTVQRA